MKKFAVLLLRILVTAGFLSLAFLFVNFRDTVETVGGQSIVKPGLISIVKQSNLTLVLALIPALLFPILCLALRWWLLLKENGFVLPFKRVFLVTYAGFFFNLVLPGAVGGDIAKALIASQGESRKAALVGTILLDRIIGLAAMVVMAAVMVIPFLGNQALRPVTNLILVLFSGGVVGYMLYFNGAIRRSGFGQWIKRILPFPAVIEQLDTVMRTMHHAKKTVLLAGIISFFAQAGAIVVIFGLARALHIEGPTIGSFFLMEPIVFIVTAVPISMGGLGVQEYVYGVLFGLIGVAKNASVALSLLYRIACLAASVPGGLLFAAGVTAKSDKK